MPRGREGGESIKHQQYPVADAGADAIDGHHGDAPVAAVEFHGLHEKEFAAFVRRVFDGRGDVAHHACDQHWG